MAGGERFSRFDDKVSGVNPFTVPLAPARRGLGGCATWALGCLLGLVRLPFLAFCLAALWLVETAADLSPGWLARGLRLFCGRISARGALAGLGFGCCSPREAVAARGTLRVRNSSSGPKPAIHAGDLLVYNRTSWVDILVLAASAAPGAWAVTSRAGGLRSQGLFAALAEASGLRAVPQALPGVAAGGEEASATTVIEAVMQRSAGPLALAPEGAPTNGRAVLLFTPAAKHAAAAVVGAAARARSPTTHVLALQYSGGGGGNDSSPPACFTFGSAVAHAWSLACRVSADAALLRLPPGCDPQPADFDGAAAAAAAAGEGAPDAPPATWPAAVRDALVQLLRVRAVALSAAQYDEFVAAAREESSVAAANRVSASVGKKSR